MSSFRFKSAILFASIILVLFSACKKETTEGDDPTINYVNLNKTYQIIFGGGPSIDSIDLNGDGTSELFFVFQNIGGGDTGLIQFIQKSQSFQTNIAGFTPMPYAKLYNKDEITPTSSAVYYQNLYVSIKFNGIRLGILNSEQYIAFRFSTGTKFQYGWMKVSVNNAYTEFKILEYAYSTQYDTPIKVGAK
jgi:hypothetical protein